MGRLSIMKYKTKRYTRDLDQILYNDMGADESLQQLTQLPIDETKPGLGQYYCIPCAKYFETESAKSHHQRGKVHKRRVRDLKQGPYTKEEADAAAGHNVAVYLAKTLTGKDVLSNTKVNDILSTKSDQVVALSTSES